MPNEPIGIIESDTTLSSVMPIKQDDNGPAAFLTTTAYTDGAGNLLAPIPVIIVNDDYWPDPAGNLRGVVGLNFGGVVPVDWDWQAFTMTPADTGDWIGYTNGDIAPPPFNPPEGTITGQPTSVTTLQALYSDGDTGEVVAVFNGDYVGLLDGLPLTVNGVVLAPESISLQWGSTWVRYSGLPSGFVAGTPYTVLFGDAVIEVSFSGSGYAGSVYNSTVAAQWFADGEPIDGATGNTWTMTREYEGAAIACGGSDPIEMWMPDDLPNGIKSSWYDPKQGQVVVSGGGIAAWPDQFGGAPLVQDTASLQPTTVLVDGVEFASYPADSYRHLQSATNINVRFVATVAQYGEGTETAWAAYWQTLLGFGGNGSSSCIRGSSETPIWGSAGVFDGALVSKNGGAANIEALPLPLSLITVPFTAEESRRWGLGTSQNANANRRWQGLIGETLLLADTPSADNVKRIEGCLAHRNGVAALLPTDHPYKTTGPQVSA